MAGKTILVMLACTLAMPVAAAPPRPAKKPAARAVKPAVRPAAAIAPLPDTPEVAGLRAAYAFAVPVYAMMRARHLQLDRAAGAGTAGVNRFDAGTPDGDTLRSSAWLDLAGGPVVLTTPALSGRYHSAALIDLFTDTVAIVGSRSGGEGGRYMIAGPAWTGDVPAGLTLLRVPTNDAWLLVRVAVDGPGDLAAASGLVRGFTLDVPAGNGEPAPTKAVPTAVPDAATLIAVVDEALSRSPSIAARKVHPELGIAATGVDPAAVPAATMALWQASLPALRAEVRSGAAAAGSVVDGWSYPDARIGNFGDDDAGRARVALDRFGALPRTEAIDLTAAADKDGAALSGAKAYTVRVPGRLPVGAFWSLAVVGPEAEGARAGPAAPPRSAVGDRTPGLRAERDGGYDIFVQAGRPSGERVLNWLPAPAGRFALVWRAYLPRAELLDGSFRLPPVAATETIP